MVEVEDKNETPVEGVAVSTTTTTSTMNIVEGKEPLTRVSKPDKSAHDVEVKKIQKDIDVIQKRLLEIRAEADACQTKGGQNEEIQKLRAEMNEIKTKRNALIQERNAYSTKMKSLRSESDSIKSNEKQLRSEVRFTNMNDIEEEINNLRYKQETQSMSLGEEKKLIKDIEALQQSKKIVSKFSSERGNLDKCMGSLKEVRAMHDLKNAEVDTISQQMNAKKKELDDAYAVQNAKRESNPFPKLMEERKKLKGELDELYSSIRKLRITFKEKNDAYYNFVRAQREQRKEEQRLEDEKRQAEYEVKLEQYNNEMAKIHPYQDEMDLCDALVKYFNATFLSAAPAETKVAAAASCCSGSCSTDVALDGMKPLVRKQEDFIFMGKASKKSGKKKMPKAKKLSLPIAQMESFSTIGLLPPMYADKVSESVAAIQARKKEFLSKTTRDATRSNSSTASRRTETSKKEKKSSKYDVQLADFPSLGQTAVDSNGAVAPGSSWGRPVAAPSVQVPVPQESN